MMAKLHNSINSKLSELSLLKQRMMDGEVCKFAYIKLNGDIRVAIGTLQEDAVNAHTIGNGKRKSPQGVLCYLDLEKMAWRSFKVDRFIGVVNC